MTGDGGRGERRDIAYQVLLELATLLRPYEGKVVIIGGWSAYFLTHNRAEPGFGQSHVGSSDVDLMLAIPGLTLDEVLQIRAILIDAGYRPLVETRRPFSLERSLDGNTSRRVLVDLMAPDTDPPSQQKVVERGLWVILLDGGELARRYSIPVQFEGALPDGSEASAGMQVTDFPAFITLKGLALGDRRVKGPPEAFAKHAYDIACVLYACGPETVALSLQAALAAETGRSHELMERAISEIAAAFRSRDAGGAEAAATVFTSSDPLLMPSFTTQSFEAAAAFLRPLGYEVQR